MSDFSGLPMEGNGLPFEPGEEFHGYIVERLIGRGGLGSVWLVRHRVLDTLFALKVLDHDVAEAKPEYVKRFLREAKLATRIRHPNLVAVHDARYDTGKGISYLVMDYVKGNTLREVIAFEGAQPEKDAVHVILSVASVLASAQHYGMVHRDLKPENIMIADDGVVKLLDLGIAKISDGLDSLKTTADTVFGTPSYISPEQAEDSSTVDTRADIYSLGIILFEMLTGRSPYDGRTPADIVNQLFDDTPIPDVRTFNANISAKTAAVLSLMCAKKLEDRLESPQAVIDAFSRLGFHLPSTVKPEFAVNKDDCSSETSMQNLIERLPVQQKAENGKRRDWILVAAVVIGLAALAIAIIRLI